MTQPGCVPALPDSVESRRSLARAMSWDRSLPEELVAQLWENPHELLASGEVLQDKPRCTVVRIDHGAGSWVLKYHNWGGLYPTARKTLRRAPAYQCWLDGRELAAQGLPTPLPRAVVERRIGPFGLCSYLLTDFIPGTSLYRLIRSDEPPADVAAELAEQVAGIWRQFEALRVSHNDLKPENFQVDDEGRVWLIDLEKMRHHKSLSAMLPKLREDAKRFLHPRLWHVAPDAAEIFRQRLLETTAAGQAALASRDDRHPLVQTVPVEPAMKNKLTVLIPCKDEVKNIRACIESVRDIADEILVADSGSTDGTLDVVRSLGDCRIIEREYINSADFKNWAIPQAEHPWVLVVDADERVTPDLAKEIQCILAGEPDQDGYRIERRTYFFGHLIKYGNCWSDSPLRLFRRECRYQVRNVHADVIVSSGKVGKTKSKFLHYTCWTIDAYMKTLNRYTTWSAQDMHKRGRRATILSTIVHAPWRFFHTYFLRLGFLDGWAGLQVSILSSCYICVKLAKLWEMDFALPQPDPEARTPSGSLKLFNPESAGPDSPSELKPAV